MSAHSAQNAAIPKEPGLIDSAVSGTLSIQSSLQSSLTTLADLHTRLFGLLPPPPGPAGARTSSNAPTPMAAGPRLLVEVQGLDDLAATLRGLATELDRKL